MPSALPRVQVRLTPHQHEVLADIARLTRLSMSRVVSDLIEPHMPVLERTAQMLIDASELTEEARAQLVPELTAQARKLQRMQATAHLALADAEAAIGKARSRTDAPRPPSPAHRTRRTKSRSARPR